MKPLPIQELLPYCARAAITKRAAEHGLHANHAKDAYERATIVLRLLLGEREWTDGYERRLDDCFENGDGDAVCGWLIEFAENDSNIRQLLVDHWNLRITGSNILAHWNAKGYRLAHRASELSLNH